MMKTKQSKCFNTSKSCVAERELFKTNATVDVTRKVQKFLNTNDRDVIKTTLEHVEGMKNQCNVLKSAVIIATSPTLLVECALKNVLGGKHTHENHCTFWGSAKDAKKKAKTAIDNAVQEVLTTRILVEASPDKACQHSRQELEKDFAKGQFRNDEDIHPNTVAATAALLNKHQVKPQKQIPKTEAEAAAAHEKKGNGAQEQSPNEHGKEDQSKRPTAEDACQMLIHGMNNDDSSDKNKHFVFAQHAEHVNHTPDNDSMSEIARRLARHQQRSDVDKWCEQMTRKSQSIGIADGQLCLTADPMSISNCSNTDTRDCTC